MEQYSRFGPPPDATLAALMRMRETLGITRVADITGLDRVGIPVVQVTRPCSLSNTVAQGKGTSLGRAAISAILESAESFFAERTERFDIVEASAAALDLPYARFALHLRDDVPADWQDRVTAWVAADDLMGGGRHLVPLELVHTAYVVPPSPTDGIFIATTTGLAVALDTRDAVTHGVLECVERDALARAHRRHGFFQHSRIDPATIEDDGVLALLDELAAKGLLVGLWLAPSPTGVPAIWCHLLESGPRETALLHLPAEGSAAALDPAAAIIHAIHEAAQARLAAISGARDDVTRACYPKYPDWQMIAAHRRLITEGPRNIDFAALCADVPKDNQAPLPALLARLEASGVGNLFVVGLDTEPCEGLSAVRVVVPELLPLLA
ncbi:YcaO-like family protein [Starkeya sp. ORNL1]|uniref:YcaO-like family protein n=1 Tax=Starkeya sp. ORNL1 TaxID=2709380 RepID=UPI0014638EAD|nr:YcaO-like family protein [Starkeya sp. ORNL1]QJP13372.1 YcaO-like family protein [Starkeya sp. ORNL1]